MADKGYFGIGVYHAKHEVNTGTLWRSAYAFGADFVFTVGARFERQAADTVGAWAEVPMFNFRDLQDLIEHLPYSCPLMGVELAENSEALPDFIHPQRACYLAGAEDHGLPPSILRRCHKVVQIPLLKKCLNVATAGSIVMYDRVTKSSSMNSRPKGANNDRKSQGQIPRQACRSDCR